MRTPIHKVRAGLKAPHWKMHQASLSGLKFVCGDLSVTTCDPEFSSVMLSEHYHFFLSGGRHKHTIYYELEAVIDLDLGGERKRLWKDKSGDFPLRISNFENKFQALKKKKWLDSFALGHHLQTPHASTLWAQISKNNSKKDPGRSQRVNGS